MSQHDYIIADAAGSAFLADLNLAVKALAENNSGTSEPAVMYAHMWWADTTNDILKKRNAANTGWISYLTLSTGDLIGNAATATSATTAGTTGTFTISSTDFTVAKSGTATWYKNNGVVHLHIPSNTFSGTSDSVALTLTGIPAGITPASARLLSLVHAKDNNIESWASASVTASNTISIAYEGGIWTASGIKQLYTTEFTWSL